MMRELFDPQDEVFATVNDVFVEGEWVLEGKNPPTITTICTTRLVCVGELCRPK